jgi:hypothetical protein
MNDRGGEGRPTRREAAATTGTADTLMPAGCSSYVTIRASKASPLGEEKRQPKWVARWQAGGAGGAGGAQCSTLHE